MALEIGRTPTRDEFVKTIRGGKDAVRNIFGEYAVLIQAAGLDPVRPSKRISSAIFDKDVNKHLASYKPIIFPEQKPYPRIACISDIHWPFHCQRVIDKFYRFIEREQPQYIIVDGDARDFYSHAKFPRSQNQFTPREENELGRKQNVEFWLEVKKLVPVADCRQLLGNHCIRPLKRVIESYPEAEDWIKDAINKEFTFDGVSTTYDPREEVIIEDIMIHHGYRSQLGSHRDYTLQNMIVGHTHRPGVVFRQIRGKVLWELNCGYAGDPNAKGLSYTSQKATDWVNGFGFVDQDGPRVIIA